MDNEELSNILLACIEKLKDKHFEVDFKTECHICKLGDVLLNGTPTDEVYSVKRD